MAPGNPLDEPTPAPPPAKEESKEEGMPEIDLDDSAELTPENMQALLARAKLAGRVAARKTRMAFDATKALADSGMLRTTKFHKKKSSNGTG